jgi:hypothetical protein
MRAWPGRVAIWLVLAAATVACTSPEAKRVREGGRGADPGNRRGVVLMHEGADAYWRTPRRIAEGVQAPSDVARQADRLSRGQPDPSASPPSKTP